MPVVLPKRPRLSLARTPIASAVLLALASPALMAQDTTSLGEVIVTAQKREQSLQDVPISIKALGEETLDELNIQNFKDYVQFLPTVTMPPSDGAGSGFNAVYMRGVATGGDGQATTSQPSVGMYLDEQPITTIQGNLDVHLYDIARVEALAGPQGTLYGASSQAGTIRIITNKPDPSGFAASYALEGNYVDMDEPGYVAEGIVNLPIGDNAAIRLVGWAKHDAGWIDNVAATRTYDGDPSTNADDFTDGQRGVRRGQLQHDRHDRRARAAARQPRRELDHHARAHVPEAGAGRLLGRRPADELSSSPATRRSRISARSSRTTSGTRLGLTVEGSIGDWDVVYSGNYLDRDVDGSLRLLRVFLLVQRRVHLLSPACSSTTTATRSIRAMSFSNDDQYKKTSHEIRISSPQDNRVRGLLGFFYQKQEHDFYQEFGRLDGLADQPRAQRQRPERDARFPGVVYLNSMDREDTDQAVFGTIAFDITDTLELSVGARYFEPEVTVKGFFGFGLGLNRRHARLARHMPGPDDAVGAAGDPRTAAKAPSIPQARGGARTASGAARRRPTTAAESRPARTSTRASPRATASTA